MSILYIYSIKCSFFYNFLLFPSPFTLLSSLEILLHTTQATINDQSTIIKHNHYRPCTIIIHKSKPRSSSTIIKLSLHPLIKQRIKTIKPQKSSKPSKIIKLSLQKPLFSLKSSHTQTKPTISTINPPSSSTTIVDHAPSLTTDQNPNRQAPSSSFKPPQAHPQQLIFATTDLSQISPSLCLYCVFVYGLIDFPLSLWLFYYVLQSCSGGCGRLLDWVVVA